MKVAIVHNSWWKLRGGERVFLDICKIFPDADIFLLFGNKVKLESELIKCGELAGQKKIHFTFLQKLPYINRLYRVLLPVWPIAIESLNFEQYDLVISLNSSVEKGIIVPPETTHISYIFTPMRFLWDQKDSYINSVHPIFRFILYPLFTYLRVWDISTSKRVDKIIPISNLVKRRLELYHKVNCEEPIYPHIKLPNRSEHKVWEKKAAEAGYKLPFGDEPYYIAVSPFKENKGGEKLLKLFKEIGKNCLILGGDRERNLGPNIVIKGWIDEEIKWFYISNAKALCSFGVEDFGILPIESLALGTPVISLNGSGFLELFQIDKRESSGILTIDEINVSNFTDAINLLDKNNIRGNLPVEILTKLSFNTFKEKLLHVVNS